MGNSGGATIFYKDKLEELLKDKEIQDKIILYLDKGHVWPEDVSWMNEIKAAISAGSIDELSAAAGYLYFHEIYIKDIEIILIPYGDNVPPPIQCYEHALKTFCWAACAWSDETWT